MKFGEQLLTNIAPIYGEENYLNYAFLKKIIKQLSKQNLQQTIVASSKSAISLSVPPPTDQRTNKSPAMNEFPDGITQEAFFTAIQSEMTKVENFTAGNVKLIRSGLIAAEKALNGMGDIAALKLAASDILSQSNSSSALQTKISEMQAVEAEVRAIGQDFLRLEKYVNLNFTGFHKILKKHDKFLPNKCKAFYIGRMHSQAWVKGDYSDIVVQMSRMYSLIRGDNSAQESDSSSQSFMRSTTKYWVNTEDVSKVKYEVLQNLPVFLQTSATGETDSQMTNSVYLDNSTLELYHGRLDKTPGAIAVRLRWYSAGAATTVFVERKTHRDTWTGEVSVKERFIISEKEVQSVMNGTYDIEKKRNEMIKAKKPAEDIREWEQLVREIVQAINSKQLVPTMRTQYTRTAFQIPFDATVRVSLDTNLCMISERGYNLEDGKKWHRDPELPISNTEIARFPHAVLEIKLEVKEGATVPAWVTELQNSGLLYEVHKFSKFIHGCATLLHDDVHSVPYWVDDASLRESIVESGAGYILTSWGQEQPASDGRLGAGPGANQLYPHLLPHGTSAETSNGKMSARTGVHFGNQVSQSYQNYGIRASDREFQDDYDDDDDDYEGVECGCWPSTICNPSQVDVIAPSSIQKVEPKVFFANERTFLHWLHMSVFLSSVSATILAFGGLKVQLFALILLPLSLGIAAYALHIFHWRAERIRLRIPGRWDDPLGPVVIAMTIGSLLVLQFAIELHKYIILS
jgi:SPX domain protein involved in polyphosphate accumulation/uncharacterized membrane protein YidH (DUF202 family)